MRENPTENSLSTQIRQVKKYLKVKIQEDNVTFRNHIQARNHVYDLVKRTVVHGESHSALIIGPRGCGKTTLINSVLHQLSKEVDLADDAIIVRLDGLVHHDEKVALKSITAQLQLENAVDGKVFGTFAEQLSFLLSCLTAQSARSRSMVFLLEQCDMFCRVGRVQSLLYNLFDITHARSAPMCVAGITNRIDVMDLLEKRVKSRFSHRHIFIFPNEVLEGDSTPPSTPLDNYMGVMVELLSLPVAKKEVKKRGRKKSNASEEAMDSDEKIQPVPEEVLLKCKIDPKEVTLDPMFVEDWNAHVGSLAENEKVIDAIEKFCYYKANEQVFRNILFQLVSKLKATKPYIEPPELCSLIDKTVCSEHRVKMLQSLSIVELSLIIAMMHGTQLLDGQPLNFEMVLHRYQKFAQLNSSTQSVSRPVILKAFEHLQALELVVAGRSLGQTCGEHRLYALAAPVEDIRTAVNTAKMIPTELLHCLDHSVL